LTIVIKKPRGRTWLIAAGVMGLAVVVTWMVLLGPLSGLLPGVDLDAPQTLGDLPVVWQASGTEASDELARLHGKPIPITGGVVARYQEGSHAAMLWVSQSPSAGMAARLNTTMTARIAEGNSPFEPFGTIDIEGQTVYLLTDGTSGRAA
jgi:hypothetical protein